MRTKTTYSVILEARASGPALRLWVLDDHGRTMFGPMELTDVDALRGLAREATAAADASAVAEEARRPARVRLLGEARRLSSWVEHMPKDAGGATEAIVDAIASMFCMADSLRREDATEAERAANDEAARAIEGLAAQARSAALRFAGIEVADDAR